MADRRLLLAGGLTGLALVQRKRAANGSAAAAYAAGEPGAEYVEFSATPREDWPVCALAQKLTLLERNGAWPERSGTQGWIPVMTLDDADVIAESWRRVVRPYGPADMDFGSLGGAVYLGADGQWRPRADVDAHGINPWRSLERRLAEVAALVSARTGEKVVAGAPLAALATEDVDALMAFDECELFWRGIVSVSTDLAAVESYEPLTSWGAAMEAVAEAWEEAPGTFAEYTVRAAAWAARQAGRVAAGVGRAAAGVVGGLVSGLFAEPVVLAAGLVVAWYAWKR